MGIKILPSASSSTLYAEDTHTELSELDRKPDGGNFFEICCFQEELYKNLDFVSFES